MPCACDVMKTFCVCCQADDCWVMYLLCVRIPEQITRKEESSLVNCYGKLYRVVQGCTGLYRVVQGCTGLYRVVQGCTGLYT